MKRRQLDAAMIDETDIKIIGELAKNGRKSYTELAKTMNLVEGTIRKRVNRLLREKAIEISAVPLAGWFGLNCVSIVGIQVRMSELRQVANQLANNPRVCYLAFVTGRYDIIALIVARTPKEIGELIENDLSAIPSILRTETFVNLDVIKGKFCGIDIAKIVSPS